MKKRIIRVVVVACVVGTAALILDRVGKVLTPAPPAASGIAVLPFESLSSDKENAFFADGVYDGVSTKLAKVANLKVISHNSVAKYRGARNTQEIGRALNVAYVLKGSVRKEAGRIHLNVQLIDTRTDAQVWAQEYDRNLSDVFALQSEIAQAVADQLGAQVSSTEKAAIQEPPTTDLVAYDSYLRAKDLINGISFSTRAKEDLMQAVQLLDQAASRDPFFFLAYAELEGAHDRIYFLGFDHTDARIKLAEIAVRSMRLAASRIWRNAFGPRAASLLGVCGLRRSQAGAGRCPAHPAKRDRAKSRGSAWSRTSLTEQPAIQEPP